MPVFWVKPHPRDLILCGFFTESISINNDTTLYSQDGLDDYFYDLVISKYSPMGELQGYKTIGGQGEDKIIDVTFSIDELVVTGQFADTMNWGGIESRERISSAELSASAFGGSVPRSSAARVSEHK